METSEPLARGAVEAPDLAELLARPGPFLSVYLNTESRTKDAAQRSQIRWKTARAIFEEQDVPGALLDAIEQLVPDAHLHGECLAVLANPDGILHVEFGAALGMDEQTSWGAVPRFLPILRWRQSEPPYVVVVTDRTGADLYGFRRGAPEIHADVEGEHDVIRKVQAGGWSQRRYQQRAEDSWAGNAKQVAESVVKLVDRVRPELVVVAGDVRAVTLLRRALPERVAALVHELEWEPPHEGPAVPIPDDVDVLVQEHEREATEALLARFAEERGQHDRAVEGMDATARALALAQGAALLIADEPHDEQKLWVGPEARLVAPTEGELIDLGVDAPIQGPARDALVRAALGTGAGIRVLEAGDERPEAPRNRVGALLRWTAA